METTYRPAVRVICMDASARVLLMRWRDPHDGGQLWEPPGGGIESGETPLRAARRELVEETGLDPDVVGAHSIPVPRDVRWNGKRFVGDEPFFLARYTADRPELSRGGLLPDEQTNLVRHEWFTVPQLETLDRLEPPELARVIDALTRGAETLD